MTLASPLISLPLVLPLLQDPGVQVLTIETVWSVPGVVEGHQFGSDLAALGDVDGDGTADLLVGASNSGVFEGRAFVISGATGRTLYYFELKDEDRAFWNLFPSDVAALGDLDGDGVCDYVLGDPSWDPINGEPPNRAWVLSGKRGEVLFELESDPEEGSWVDGFGVSVAGIADLNGDSCPDLIVAAPWGGPPYVDLISGKDASLLLRIEAEDETGWLGWSVAALGDLNGDRISELAAADTGRWNDRDGRVFLYSGRDGELLRELRGRTSEEDRFGEAICPAPDLDGDGVSDLLIGAPREPCEDRGRPGAVYAISGRTGKTIYRIHGEADEDRLGSGLAVIADLDGDGVHEALIGAPGPDAGDHPGHLLLVSGRTGAPLLRFQDEEFGDELGAELCSLGDLDGDGSPEFAASDGARGMGRVWLYSIRREAREKRD